MNSPQLSLDFAGRARKRDPGTSHKAAARVSEFAARDAARIVLALKDHGAGNIYAIAEWSGLTAVAVARRAPELQEAGAIELTGATAETPSGRPARVWRVVKWAWPPPGAA